MPVYDFKCQDCGHQFTVLIHLSEKDKLNCPKCSGQNIRQVLSPFSMFGRKPSRDGCGSSGCGSGGFMGGG